MAKRIYCPGSVRILRRIWKINSIPIPQTINFPIISNFKNSENSQEMIIWEKPKIKRLRLVVKREIDRESRCTGWERWMKKGAEIELSSPIWRAYLKGNAISKMKQDITVPTNTAANDEMKKRLSKISVGGRAVPRESPIQILARSENGSMVIRVALETRLVVPMKAPAAKAPT